MTENSPKEETTGDIKRTGPERVADTNSDPQPAAMGPMAEK